MNSPIIASNPQQEPLSDHVTKTVQKYFNSRNDSDNNDLYKTILEEVEVPLLENVMKYTKNNQVQAAKVLGLSRGTLRKKLKMYFDDVYCGTRDEK